MSNKLKLVIDKLTSFYTVGNAFSRVAVIFSYVVVLFTISVVAITAIYFFTSYKKNDQNDITTMFIDTTREETTLPTTTVLPETIESTTVIETTTVATTVEETTVTETTTAPPAPTQAETIAVDKLNIGDSSKSTEKFVDKSHLKNEFMDYNPPTQKPTSKPSTSGNNTGSTTAPTAAFNENVCFIKGIDISKWNAKQTYDKKADKTVFTANIDWSKVKASGVKFVFVRLGFTYQSQTPIKYEEDPVFKAHVDGALAAGLQVGVYYYSQAITEKEALEEASFVLSVLSKYGYKNKLSYPVAFDWEPVSGSRAGNARLSKTQATAVAKKFMSTIKSYGYDVMLYSYSSAIKTYFDMSSLSSYKVWLARYYNRYQDTGNEYKEGEPLPEEVYKYQIWQYSSAGKVPGINGYVDMNVALSPIIAGGKKNNITFSLPQNNYYTLKNTKIDYIKDVKGYDSYGYDITSSIKVSVKNSSGAVVNDSTIFKTPGVYSITYSLTDFTGTSNSITAKLYVQEAPTIKLNKSSLSFDVTTSTYEDVYNALIDNISSISDYQGNKISSSKVIITGIENIKQLIEISPSSPNDETTTFDPNLEETVTTDSSGEQESILETEANQATTDSTLPTETTITVETLVPGTYNVTYSVTDNNNLTGTATVTLTLTTSSKEAVQ